MPNRPVHEIRFGRVKAAIWRNETDNGPRHNVTFQRIFHTEDGWDQTTTFGRDDLPLLAKVADLAHTWIYQESRDEAENDTSTSDAKKEDGKQQKRQSRTRTAAAR